MGGTLLLRDMAKQVQDTTSLSRDVEHANNALSPIFNKEKEQKRLKQAQLIGEIGAQVMDIVRTEGELKAQKAAEAKGDAKVKRPQDGDSAQEWEAYKKALTESPTYKAEMQKYGTGSDFQRAAQAATAAIQALAGGDIQKAIASGASPYLAQLVKDVTIPKDESKITASDIAANAMAHAVVGAVVAQLSGQDAAAGAIGASSGELIARAIMADQYPGKTANDLTEEEKQSVSALSTLASGLVSGLASNSTASAASGAQSGRNAVENNALGADAGTAFGFWFGKNDECGTACKAEIAKGIAEGNLVVSAGVAGVAGGAMIVGATPEIVAAAKAALEGCKAAPTICLNNAGLQVAEAVTPGGVGAAGAIGVGKTVAEATVAKAEAVAANAARNANNAASLKMDLKTTEAANEVVESLRSTGKLPQNYVNKAQATANGWKPGKALNNTNPDSQLGGDIFENSTNLLPSVPGRVWQEADIGLKNTMSRSNQPGTRLLYSNDGLLYITTDHYETATSIGKWK
ncbi:hypothetical protein BV921_22960 [Pectobacterium odoriferum]|uniref:VENN motif pre-toxin domain-containing protein n=1 Tax=Pectobacterium odoriferum TaxID=78398 RepID=UPI000CD046D2|nr:VENN motif pre-toxin domain-containing protein [Pectobacterium odoriferum]POE06219.1 hypothetical protein BV921_22960 [Pectobacterium odoriferum]